MPIQFKNFKIDGAQGGGGFSVGKLKEDFLPSGTPAPSATPLPTATPAPTGTPAPSATAAGATPTPNPTNFLSVMTWGDNSLGYLARNTADITWVDDTPRAIPYAGAWKMFATGATTTNPAGIKNDNTLWVWGNNANGQLGQNNLTHRKSPMQIAGSWSHITANFGAMIGVKTDGSIWSWGYNLRGQLGDNSATNRSSPVQLADSAGTSWTMASLGSLFAAAIKSDGTLWAFGENTNGQLGQNDIIHRSSPVQIGNGTTWTKVVCGRYHWLALKSDNTLWGCGSHGSGQLGTGSMAIGSRSSPVQVGTANDWVDIFTSITSSDNSAGLKSNGTMFAWGYRNENNFGDGYYNASTVLVSTPVQIGTATDWKKIGWYYKGSTGFSSPNRVTGFKVSTNGSLYVWGRDSWGLLGQGTGSTAEDTNISSPIQTVINDRNWTQVVIQDRMLIGLRASATDPLPTPMPTVPPTPTPAPTGALYTWGYGSSINGYPNVVVPYVSAEQIGTNTNWVYVSDMGTIGIDSANKMWFWGGHMSDTGKGASYAETFFSSPVQSLVNTGVWRKAQNNSNGYTCVALRTDGTLWGTGHDSAYIFNKANTYYGTFQQITTGITYMDFATTTMTMAAIRTNGTLWTWGANYGGELADGNVNNWRSSPVQIGATIYDVWRSVYASPGIYNQSYGAFGGIKTDGTAWLWGSGTLFNPDYNSFVGGVSPLQFNSGYTYQQLFPYIGGVFGLRTDGTVWGVGTNTSSTWDPAIYPTDGSIKVSSPTQVTSFNDVKSLHAVDGLVVMLRNNNQMWVIGYDGANMGGGGLGTTYSSPVQVTGGHTWLEIKVSGAQVGKR